MLFVGLKKTRRFWVGVGMVLAVWASTKPLSLAENGEKADEAASEYSRLTQPPCRTKSVQVEGANSEQTCPGLYGYKLALLDSDGRMSVTVISPDNVRHPLDFWTTVTSHFSSLGKRAEWRIRKHSVKTAPEAVILPLSINEDPDLSAVTNYLVVARVDSSQVCVVQRLKNSPDGLAEARKVADHAHEMKCMVP